MARVDTGGGGPSRRLVAGLVGVGFMFSDKGLEDVMAVHEIIQQTQAAPRSAF